jgi:DNA-binding transcriptional LysR family regulator
MDTTNFDIDALRAFVLANDLGGYGRAAARLGRTPSAVSLQMKRLQRDVGAPLYRKDGRRTALTEIGALVLRFAREIVARNDELHDTLRGATLAGAVRFGCSQDFVDGVLPRILAALRRRYPLVVVELHIDGGAALVAAVERGDLDLALAIGHAGHATAQQIGELELAWIASREFSPPHDAPLPLLVLGPKCAFRQAAVRALDADGRTWRVAAVSPSLAGLWASAAAGLGVTLRTAFGVSRDLASSATLFGLPRVGTVPVSLHRHDGARGEVVTRLAALARAEVEARSSASEAGAPSAA